MTMRLAGAVSVILLCATTNVGGQEPVGPVTPKPTNTVGSYERALDALLRDNAPDRLWENSDTAQRRQIVRDAENVQQNIQGLPVGPVVPKPTPVTPKPRPKAPTPPPDPTKQEIKDVFKDLHETLQRTSKSDPKMNLPQREDQDLKRLLEALAKGSAR